MDRISELEAEVRALRQELVSLKAGLTPSDWLKGIFDSVQGLISHTPQKIEIYLGKESSNKEYSISWSDAKVTEYMLPLIEKYKNEFKN